MNKAAKSRILLIDDDETYFNAIQLMLLNHPIEVVCACKGAAGLAVMNPNLTGGVSVNTYGFVPSHNATPIENNVTTKCLQAHNCHDSEPNP